MFMNKENWKPRVIGGIVYVPTRLMYVILAFLIVAFIAVVIAAWTNISRTMKYESTNVEQTKNVSVISMDVGEIPTTYCGDNYYV